MSDVTENDLLEAILATLPVPYDPTVHVTARAVAERQHISENSALEILQGYADEGRELPMPDGTRAKIKRLENGVRMRSGYTVVAFVRA